MSQPNNITTVRADRKGDALPALVRLLANLRKQTAAQPGDEKAQRVEGTR